MRGFLQRLQSLKNRSFVVVLLMLFAAASASGQSGDVNFPTPVVSDSVSGRITPRDIGDARLTRHFYTFNASEGDLLITVESTNLNGDVDLFTAVTLRPLAKVTLYAGATPTRATKSVYLRRSETLVLRIEGRTAFDAEAAYTVRFAGAFTPATNVAPEVVAVPTLQSEGGDRDAQRASSVGARIEVPRTETPATETAETATPTETPAEAPTEGEATPATAATTKPKPRRTVRVRRPPARSARTRTPDPPPDATAENSGAETSGGESSANKPAETPARTTTAPRRRNPRNRASTSRRNDTSASEASASPASTQISTLLIIVNRDGTRIERDMSGVRRVTVENGMIVVTGRDGKTERLPMADVLRMSIEPQLQNTP